MNGQLQECGMFRKLIDSSRASIITMERLVGWVKELSVLQYHVLKQEVYLTPVAGKLAINVEFRTCAKLPNCNGVVSAKPCFLLIVVCSYCH